jgi:hypothetical protein
MKLLLILLSFFALTKTFTVETSTEIFENSTEIFVNSTEIFEDYNEEYSDEDSSEKNMNGCYCLCPHVNYDDLSVISHKLQLVTYDLTVIMRTMEEIKNSLNKQ